MLTTAKERLLQKATEVNNLLSAYIEIHNARLKHAGTLSSFLKNIFLGRKVDFEGLHKATLKLANMFENKQTEIDKLGKNQSEQFTELEKEFYNSLKMYFGALFQTIKALLAITEAQYKTSQGESNKITFQENMKLEKDYEDARKRYSSLGQELTKQYTRLSSA